MPAMKRMLVIGVAAAGLLSVGVVIAASDFGAERDASLASRSHELFGTGQPLAASSTTSITAAQAQTDPTALVSLADGLHARVVSTTVAPIADQMALWPDDDAPTHLIVLNESGTTDPGLQRVSLADGSTETIVSGTTSGDPVRRTPWGTILFGEEAD